MEGVGSLDNLDWTRVEPDQMIVPHGVSEVLLEGEKVVMTEFGVVLLNTDEAGTLLVTNFRLLFMSEGTRNIISFGTIPLATIEKFKLVDKNSTVPHQLEKVSSRPLLKVVGKDMRIIMYGFRPHTQKISDVFDALWRWTKALPLCNLYAFVAGPGKTNNMNTKVRLLTEYCRLLGKESFHFSNRIFDDGVSLSNEWWRISGINSNYKLCPTYPFSLIIPKCISDLEIQTASTFRARCRLPVISWCNSGTGAVLARSSQPLIGLMMNSRSDFDERLVRALCSRKDGDKRSMIRKLYIADARPRKNALANGAMGGGSESSANYSQSEVVFFGIDNIHAMRKSLARLRHYLDTHGVTSSDGQSSFLRNGGWTWGGGNLSSMSASVSAFGDSGWLFHVQTILAGSAWIAARIALEAASVLVHCSDGWDRTAQLVSLASLLLDPYYRTFKGFQVLVEKDWLAFGHPFADRMGMQTSKLSSSSSDLTRQSSIGNASTSPMRTSSTNSSSHAQTSENCSPIFLQWVDCISQLLRMYPCAFEFSSTFLVDFLDCFLSCRFGNFLCNSEKERLENHIADSCGCIWSYLSDLRASEGSSHAHYNLFYDPVKYDEALLPPAAALAPTLWPQFHLRWACPSEAQSGELELQFRSMAKKFSDIKTAKETAEAKAKDVVASMESLTVELLKEKKISSSAIELARRACKESLAINRAIQSLGCKVQFSSSGNCDLGLEGAPFEIKRKFIDERNKESNLVCEQEEKSDVAVSISLVEDGPCMNFPETRECEPLCPFRTREGCKWPDAGCAQFGSQFVGLKANFDAIDRLTINDSYFGPA